MPDYGYVEFRRNLRQASFRGVPFFVEVAGKRSGRRTVEHEYPKVDTPYSEDVGRRMYRFTVLGYIIGPTFFYGSYDKDRDNLENALEDSGNQGPGVLILPTRGITGVINNLFTCREYSCNERRQWGGYAEFEMQFSEAGQPGITPATSSAQAMSIAGNNALQTSADFLRSLLSVPPTTIDETPVQ